MKVIKQKIGNIIIFVYMVVGTLGYNSEEISIALTGAFFLILGWFWRQIIKNEITFSLEVRNYPMDIKVIGIFFIFEMLLFVKNTFLGNLNNGINNWCVLGFLFCLLYVYVCKKRDYMQGMFDSVIYAGTVVMGIMLFAYAGNEDGIVWISNLVSDKSMVASWALLVSIIGVISYCFCENKMKSRFYFMATALSFLILCINHDCISFWLLLFALLSIPVIFRPVAELIKRDMQMLFLFVFMLSNISLIANYTDFLLVETNFSLESSVYLELLLAIGGLVFFHFWDRLPENADLNKISMIKFQGIFGKALWLLVIAFIGIVFGGNSWSELPDTLSSKMIKSAAIPVVQEVAQKRSELSVIIEYEGIVGMILLLGLSYLILKKLLINYHVDKQITSTCMVISILFLMQLLFFMPAINVLPVYYLFFLYGAFIEEDKRKVIIIKKQQHGGEKNEIFKESK